MRIVLATAIALIIAVPLDLAIEAFARQAFAVSPQFEPFQGTVAPYTGGGVILAGVAFAVVRRLFRDAVGVFVGLAIVALVLSWIPDVALLFINEPGATVLAVASLMVMHAVAAAIVVTSLVKIAAPYERELHRFRRRVEAVRLGLLDSQRDLRNSLEPRKESTRDVGRNAFDEHPRPAGDLLADTGGDAGDVESGREVVSFDRLRDVDRQRNVDQVVVRLLLLDGRCALPAAAAEPADDDATGQLTSGWHTSRTVSVA